MLKIRTEFRLDNFVEKARLELLILLFYSYHLVKQLGDTFA